ncbi:MAG: twin-arginine translocase subunit TatC [Blastocatellia bacterium]|nr:twin-arginine translocase subunit TatC [Blastocatellia bacterium]
MSLKTEDLEPKVEDELAGTEMSLLEHLEELRQRLLRCALAILILLIGCWFFREPIFQFLEVPVREALARAEAAGVRTALEPQPYEWRPGDRFQYSLPEEVRIGKRVISAGTPVPARVEKQGEGLAIVLAEPWMTDQGLIPAGTRLPNPRAANPTGEKLIITTVQEAFSLYIRVSFYAALFLAMPFLLYQLWAFVSPGLYRHERRYVLPFLIMGSAFFVLGAAFGYYIAFPRVADWLLQLGSEFRPLLRASDYFDLILVIMLGLGAVFQIPTITLFLARMGVITPQTLLRPWRYALMGIFVLAAIISPTGDIANLMVFALPMIILYFFSIGIAWIVSRAPARRSP